MVSTSEHGTSCNPSLYHTVYVRSPSTIHQIQFQELQRARCFAAPQNLQRPYTSSEHVKGRVPEGICNTELAQVILESVIKIIFLDPADAFFHSNYKKINDYFIRSRNFLDFSKYLGNSV